MPIEVDVAGRLAEIAQATLSVVREHGAQGVTIRSVAKALGGSTTRVTNYLPSRSALLRNAIAYALGNWDKEAAALLDDAAREERLAVLAGWLVSTDPTDPVIRQLFLELLARSPDNPEVGQALREDASAQMALLRDQAEAAGGEDPEFIAAVLHLVTRGFYLSTLESPEEWTSDRAGAVVGRLVELLLAH